MRFSKILNEVICSFTISANGPVIIADGNSNRTNPEKADTCFLTSRNNGETAYVIPGSSIKGVIRKYVEECFYFNDDKINALFGSVKTKPPLKSKVVFSDAFADMKTVKTDMFFNTAISPIGQGVKGGSLNSVEAVVEGDFHTGFTMKNADDTEFHYIAKALNGLGNGEICIGGRKSRGFGNVKIKNFKLIVSNGFDMDLKPVIVAEYDDVKTLLNDIEKGKISLSTEVSYV